MTNEQTIIKLQEEAEKLKQAYLKVLENFLKKKEDGNISKNDILLIHKKAIEYFNFYEKLVGESELLGAHKKEKWIISFAEDCATILNNYLEHWDFIRSWKKELEIKNIKPSECAMSNLQRMMVEYLDKNKVNKLKRKFIKKNLPICGFNYKKSFKWKIMNMSLKNKIITGIGVVGSFASIYSLILNDTAIASNIYNNINNVNANNSNIVINYGTINNNQKKITINQSIDNKILILQKKDKNLSQKDFNTQITLINEIKKINNLNISFKEKNKKCKNKAKFLHKYLNYNLKLMNDICDYFFKNISNLKTSSFEK